MIFFIVVLTLSILYIGSRLLFALNEKQKKAKWRRHIVNLISNIISSCGSGNNIYGPVPKRIEKLLRNCLFRQCLIDIMVEYRISMIDKDAEKIQRLYEQFNLHQYSLDKLNSLRWSVLVEGIRELTIMDQKKYFSKIYYLMNSENEFVRAEAQSSIIQFFKSKGLDFLGHISYPISQWQQIKLLHQLKEAEIKNIFNIKTLLETANESVLVFTLKLISSKQLIQLYDAIERCSGHISSRVRFESRKCMADLQHKLSEVKSLQPDFSHGQIKEI